MTTEHYLKTWPLYFAAVWRGQKQFEVRKNDRNFQKGDVLILEEWDPDTKEYCGRSVRAIVTYVLENSEDFNFMAPGFCVMSIQVVDWLKMAQGV